MVLTTMHAPFPVLDGDNLRSGETRPHPPVTYSDWFDVDFVLLGCDLPDDSDDGPVDDDPEDGSDSAFGHPLSVARSFSKSLLHGGLYDYIHARMNVSQIDAFDPFPARDEHSYRDVSFGKLCQNGIARLRC
ncbi:MAG: hypothetical protein CMJ46_11805 [Planctomyces sp.]|nr:hypothetical protein [Planctomyces sp.]